MSLLNTLKQFNWADIFFIILLIRTCYVALKNGFPTELFKLLGTICAIYLGLHYYIKFSDYVLNLSGAKNLPAEYLTFFSFVLLVFLGYFIFFLLGRVFSRFLQMEAVPVLNKWGSLILSIIRSLFLMSLIIFAMVISPLGYFRDSVNNSYSGKRLFKIAPITYAWLWDSIMSRFRTQEKFNATILQVQTSFIKE